MKICLNLLAATAGGQLSRARAFLDRFDDFSPHAQLVIIKERTVLTEYTSTDRRVIIDVPVGLGKFKALRRMWWENFIMPGLVRKTEADVYLTFSHYLPHLNPGVPSVVGVSNLAPFSAEAWSEESWLVKLRMAALRHTIISSARRATRVLALSETCREILMGYGVPENKIAVTPNGVDAYWGQPVPVSGFLPRSGIVRPFLLYVSHFYRYKNHARLVEAYARLLADIRKSHQLVLVGKPYDHAYYTETELLIERLGLAGDAIIIPGEGSDRLKELYQNTKLFIFPSLIENSPNIILEAMMAGAPILTSSLPPMPEFCHHAAAYFDALDVSDMAKKIEGLLNSPDRLSDLSEESRGQACKFSWDDFVSQVLHNVEIAAIGKHA